MLRDMLRSADVLLESYRPGVMSRLGFCRSVLQQLNPVLIHCALSGFGQDGPCAQRAGHDLTYLALSGMLSHTGTTQTPVVPFPPVSDYAAGQQAATTILATLLRRQQCGQGTYIDTSLFETALSWQSFGLAGVGRPGYQLDPGTGLITGGMACYQIYATSDCKFVVLGALEEKFWAAFCQAVDRPEWIARQCDPMPQDDLIHELRQLFAAHTRNDWVERMAEVDCCFEPLLTPDEAIHQPHVSERHLVDCSPGCASPVDIRFPAKLDDSYPPSRSPLAEESADVIVKRWRTS
jgi:crotonobetainyl-CoA:carnitine CoA-transferase CaiB-like acyl-CoA transferase